MLQGFRFRINSSGYMILCLRALCSELRAYDSRLRTSGLGFRACGSLLVWTQDSTSDGRGDGGLNEQDFQGRCYVESVCNTE